MYTKIRKEKPKHCFLSIVEDLGSKDLEDCLFPRNTLVARVGKKPASLESTSLRSLA